MSVDDASKPLESDGKVILDIRKYLKLNLTQLETKKIYPQIYGHLWNLARKVVLFGEGDSVIVSGQSGCAKTTIIRNILRDLRNDESLNDNCIIVELHGLVHKTDKIAFHDIVRQLNVHILEDDNVSGSSSDMLTFALKSLQTSLVTPKSVIFVLYNFDEFCKTNNQSLLYNLFDTTHSKTVPVLVIGISCRVDVTSRFEKRVNSRFSNNVISVYSSLPPATDYLISNFLLPPDMFDRAFTDAWNDNILNLSKNKIVTNILGNVFCVFNTVRSVNNYFLAVVSKLNENHKMLTAEDFEAAFALVGEMNVVPILHSLSILELCLVIAMNHLCTINMDLNSITFESVYKRYMQFAKRSSAIPIVERPVALKAFEILEEFGLIDKVMSSKMSIKEYILYNTFITHDQLNAAIRTYKDLPTELLQWFENPLEHER